MDNILTTLRERLADCEADAEKLRAAIAVLDGTEPAREATKPVRRPRRAAANTPAEPKAAVPFGKLVKYVEEHPGETTTTIARQLDGDQPQLLALLKENEGETVRREGSRRNTRWFAITDEDRIRARAAEIEAQQPKRSGDARSEHLEHARESKPPSDQADEQDPEDVS